METMTPQSVINLCPSTKEQINLFANQLIEDVQEGVTNPLLLHTQIKMIEMALEKVKEGIREAALNEASKQGLKTFDYNGVVVEIRETGVKYDYSACGDVDWEQAKTSEAQFAQLRKDREAELKAMKGPHTMVNEQTGEVYRVSPPIRTSTTGLAVIIK